VRWPFCNGAGQDNRFFEKDKAMNKNQIEGAAKEAAGVVQKEVGKALKSPGNAIEGAAKEAAGKAQKAAGNVQEDIKDARKDANKEAEKRGW
jgi:uncharacterized protein YjbJ (UPF0337 family)